MIRRAFGTLGYLSVCLLAASCSLTAHGELTRAQCSNAGTDALGHRTGDDDGDGLYDCEDPDCWVYAFCLGDAGGNALGRVGDAGGSVSSDSGAIIQPPGDSAVAGSGDDSGGIIQFDATVPPEMCGTIGAVCAPGEACIAGTCKVPPAASQFLIRVTGAQIPDQTPATVCYDNITTDGTLCSFSPVFLCLKCLPDPYVEVAINGKLKFKTPTIIDSQSPGWNDPKMLVTLFAGDVLRFTVRDHDPPPGIDTSIFWCELEFTAAMAMSAGVIQCYPDPKMTEAPPLGVKWVVNAEYAPAPPTTQ